MPNYEQIARNIAIKQGIDPAIFTAQIRQESGFDPNARSSAGALGIAQIVPHWHPGVNPLKPVEALNYAAQHDAELLRKYGGDWRQVLSVYNSGQPDKWSDPNFASGQTYNYVKTILGNQYKPGSAVPSPTPVPTSSPSSAMPSSMPTVPSVQAPDFTQALLSSLGKGPEALFRSLTKAAMVPRAKVELPSGKTGTVGVVPTPQGAMPVTVEGKTTKEAVGAIKLAQNYLGTPYVWGGETPGGGFDCSGLLQYVWGKQGVEIPRVTYDQWNAGVPVNQKNLRPGDAVFFNMGARGPEHVGMYLGNGKFIEAPRTGLNIRISELAGRDDFLGARRYA